MSPFLDLGPDVSSEAVFSKQAVVTGDSSGDSLSPILAGHETQIFENSLHYPHTTSQGDEIPETESQTQSSTTQKNSKSSTASTEKSEQQLRAPGSLNVTPDARSQRIIRNYSFSSSVFRSLSKKRQNTPQAQQISSSEVPILAPPLQSWTSQLCPSELNAHTAQRRPRQTSRARSYHCSVVDSNPSLLSAPVDVLDRRSSPFRPLSPLREFHGNVTHSNRGAEDHIEIVKARHPSNVSSRVGSVLYSSGLLTGFRGDLSRASSPRSFLSAKSSFSGDYTHPPAFLGRYRTPSTPELRYPQRSTSFHQKLYKSRSMSLGSRQSIKDLKILAQAIAEEESHIDTNNYNVFRQSSDGTISRVPVTSTVARPGYTKVPVGTPKFIIPPRHKSASTQYLDPQPAQAGKIMASGPSGDRWRRDDDVISEGRCYITFRRKFGAVDGPVRMELHPSNNPGKYAIPVLRDIDLINNAASLIEYGSVFPILINAEVLVAIILRNDLDSKTVLAAILPSKVLMEVPYKSLIIPDPAGWDDRYVLRYASRLERGHRCAIKIENEAGLSDFISVVREPMRPDDGTFVCDGLPPGKFPIRVSYNSISIALPYDFFVNHMIALSIPLDQIPGLRATRYLPGPLAPVLKEMYWGHEGFVHFTVENPEASLGIDLDKSTQWTGQDWCEENQGHHGSRQDNDNRGENYKIEPDQGSSHLSGPYNTQDYTDGKLLSDKHQVEAQRLGSQSGESKKKRSDDEHEKTVTFKQRDGANALDAKLDMSTAENEGSFPDGTWEHTPEAREALRRAAQDRDIKRRLQEENDERRATIARHAAIRKSAERQQRTPPHRSTANIHSTPRQPPLLQDQEEQLATPTRSRRRPGAISRHSAHKAARERADAMTTPTPGRRGMGTSAAANRGSDEDCGRLTAGADSIVKTQPISPNPPVAAVTTSKRFPFEAEVRLPCWKAFLFCCCHCCGVQPEPDELHKGVRDERN